MARGWLDYFPRSLDLGVEGGSAHTLEGLQKVRHPSPAAAVTTTNQTTNQTVNKTVNQTTNQTTNQTVNQTTSLLRTAILTRLVHVYLLSAALLPPSSFRTPFFHRWCPGAAWCSCLVPAWCSCQLGKLFEPNPYVNISPKLEEWQVDLIDSNLEAFKFDALNKDGIAVCPLTSAESAVFNIARTSEYAASRHDEWVPIGLADRAAVRKPNKRATKRDNKGRRDATSTYEQLKEITAAKSKRDVAWNNLSTSVRWCVGASFSVGALVRWCVGA
jgi:hypothetical protein